MAKCIKCEDDFAPEDGICEGCGGQALLNGSAIGQFRRDESCHWYLVPESELDDFDEISGKLEGKEWLDAEDQFAEFERRFGGYRIDGYQGHRVLIEENSDGQG